MESTLLVHGLREMPQGDTDSEDGVWRRTSDALLSRWPKPSTTPITLEAEQGLGILGSPYYFYVMRTHRSFGYVVFLFEEVQRDLSTRSNVKGATPFDSGGLWGDKIRPKMDTDKKQSLFASEEVTLDCWRSDFLRYMNRNYSNTQDYVVGEPPLHGIQGITSSKLANKARAWTWEVRYPYNIASSWLRLEQAYMHCDDCSDYLDWLPRSDYEDEEILEITTILDTKVEVLEGETTMVSGTVQAALCELV